MVTQHSKKAAASIGLIIGAFVLICAIAFFLFFNSFLNNVVKPRLTDAINKGYPSYSISIGHMHYSLPRNQLDFDSVALGAGNGTITATVSRFSLSGIGRLFLLSGGKRGIAGFTRARFDAKGLRMGSSGSPYAFLCKRLRVSTRDSTVEADSINYYPAAGDEEFFKGSQYRRTRFTVVIPRCTVRGLALIDLLQGKRYCTREIQINGAAFDILVNKEKPAAPETSSPLMPNELLSAIKGDVAIDSLILSDGKLKYGERFAVGAEPAFVTFEDMMVSAKGIANHGSRKSLLTIRGQGKFMHAGTMKVLMEIPVSSPEFSIHYSGSLSGMDLSALNSYLEPGEQIRIKSGTLQSATYDVAIESGHAGGSLRAIYTNLNFAVINKSSGSEKGLSNRIVSFIANTFKIRTSNVPDKSGAIKIGKVDFSRQRDTTFLQFLWFSIRSGIKDVVGY